MSRTKLEGPEPHLLDVVLLLAREMVQESNAKKKVAVSRSAKISMLSKAVIFRDKRDRRLVVPSTGHRTPKPGK